MSGHESSPDVIRSRTWTPTPQGPADGPTDRFLRSVCLSYDGPLDLSAAAAVLEEEPSLPETDIAVAAACGDVGAVRSMLAADGSLARRERGPYGWSPLLYLAYARWPGGTQEATVEAARLLLAAGADPDDGRFWHGLVPPFTVLTGVLGGGERDEPPHPYAASLARLLLEAGADPNDGQALYNRMFTDEDDHLVLLLEFGLGAQHDGPWYCLLGDRLDTPAALLRGQLQWALLHGQARRVRLLADHGVDLSRPFTDLRSSRGTARTPAETALLAGRGDLADEIVARGAAAPMLDPVDTFVAAVLAGDGDAVRRTPPPVVERVRAARPGLPVWAAQVRAEAIPLLAECGFDLDAYGRSDVPVDDPWQTALHVAAGAGDTALVRTLLDLGANPALRDARFDGTPLDWARHFGHADVEELLAPLTPAP